MTSLPPPSVDASLSRRDRAMVLVFQLKRIELFAELSAEVLLPVAAIVAPIRMAAGEVVFEQGEEGSHLYVIASGQVEVVRDEVRLALLAAGECFGEMAMLDRTTRSAMVRSVVASELLQIGREDFYDVLDMYPQLARGVAKVLARRLRKANGA